MPESATPAPKGNKRARTRALLVEAAAQVIAEKGFERTALEEVAARAGMTRGAIYGNFGNKEELFLAVVAAKWQPILPEAQPGATFQTQMRRLAEAVVASMPARRAAAVGAASFQLYTLTHPHMQALVSKANAEIYRQMAEGLRAAVSKSALPMPAETFVRVAHAVIDGLMFLHALTPELIDDKIVFAAFEALARQDSA